MAKRSRASVACTRCKSLKVRCSDYRPCKRCTAAEIKCDELHQARNENTVQSEGRSMKDYYRSATADFFYLQGLPRNLKGASSSSHSFQLRAEGRRNQDLSADFKTTTLFAEGTQRNLNLSDGKEPLRPGHFQLPPVSLIAHQSSPTAFLPPIASLLNGGASPSLFPFPNIPLFSLHCRQVVSRQDLPYL